MALDIFVANDTKSTVQVRLDASNGSANSYISIGPGKSSTFQRSKTCEIHVDRNKGGSVVVKRVNPGQKVSIRSNEVKVYN